jgi:hypothetical protein
MPCLNTVLYDVVQKKVLIDLRGQLVAFSPDLPVFFEMLACR